MANVVKVTKKDMFNAIIALAQDADRQDVVEFAQHEIELLNKRNSADSKAKQTKAAENAALAEKIVEVLASADAPKATLEIGTAVGISTQKASPIIKSLVDQGRLVVTVEKGKKFFSVAQ